MAPSEQVVLPLSGQEEEALGVPQPLARAAPEQEEEALGVPLSGQEEEALGVPQPLAKAAPEQELPEEEEPGRK